MHKWKQKCLNMQGYLLKDRTKSVFLSHPAEYVKDFLDETGFEYYISGLDILAKYMQHVPEQYSVIVFIDLYFAISRNGYPLSLQQLVRIYQNLSRLGNIDKKKMITVATKRNIQYDIRFIVESQFITEQAIEFVEILRMEG